MYRTLIFGVANVIGCLLAYADAGWESIGKGEYTDDIIASCFKNVECQIMEVEFERDKENPDHYRIVNPYAEWPNKWKKNFIYDDQTHYIEFEVIGDKYVYVHPFTTGYTYEASNGGGGEVTVRNQANQQMEVGDFSSLEDLAQAYPSCLALYNDGYITYPRTFSYEGQGYENIIVTYSREPDNWMPGNTHENFTIRMPGASAPDPDKGWVSLGKGKMTDDVFASLYENLQSQTWEVEIQSNMENPGILRVVNPYKGWIDPGNFNLSYSQPKNDYMIIHTENAPDAWFEEFNTGYTYTGSGGGEIKVRMQIASAIEQAGYEAAASYYPDAFGRFRDNVFTVPEYAFQGGEYDVMIAFVGQGYYPVNYNRAFRIELPSSGVENAETDIEGEVIYYNLQGMRIKNPVPGTIVIESRGDKTRKVIVR